VSNRAVFLDRDGTIIEESGYLSGPEGVALIPGASGAIARLKRAGFTLIVVTNQSGIARGYYGEAELLRIHEKLDRLLEMDGSKIDRYYHCPHHPEYGGDCACRKPKTGMAEAAAGELGIDLSRSYFVGDKASDVMLGINAGGVPVLVLTGYGREERAILEAGGTCPVRVFDGLAEAADWIIEDSKGS